MNIKDKVDIENISENVINPLPNIQVNELTMPFWFSHKKPSSKQVKKFIIPLTKKILF